MVSATTARRARKMALNFKQHLWLLSNKTFTEHELAYLAYLLEEMYKAGQEGKGEQMYQGDATRAAAEKLFGDVLVAVNGASRLGISIRGQTRERVVTVLLDALQQAQAAGLREALGYAAHCAIERNGAANDLPKGDQRRTWVECKESEAVRIRDWCQRRLKQIEAQGGLTREAHRKGCE